MPATPDRYAGKPFLRLLDCYFLSLIGELEESQRQALETLEPKFQQTFAFQGNWTAIVEHQMDFDRSLRDQVETLWAGYLSDCRDRGASPNAKEFVLKLVDTNFPFVLSK
jgi:hypothetical protein